MQMLGGFLILLGCFGMGLWYRQQFLGKIIYDPGTHPHSGTVDQ